MLNESYFPKDVFGSMAQLREMEGYKYPHLQIRNLTYSKGNTRLLDRIDMEARGGELIAVLATNEEEGTELCKILGNKHTKWRTRLAAEIILNGIFCTPERLEGRVALVQQNTNFTEDMSVRQTMLFHSFLREPGTLTRSRDTKGRINALIEDLGLSQVKHTRIADLTASEKQRLNVACHLLLDTDIVILDQPTKGMDIFDTFFLVEYLRQWAARGRIVILTIHPPTYEIFTMISKVALISCGRLMYYGKRREMLSYFAFIEYPCPAYKNPSDYYLDLVTKDDLSPEAMLESSQRIDTLSQTFRRKAPPLSDPGPPGMLPPKIKKANILMQIVGLWIRALIYMYPFNVINWIKLVIIAGIISVCAGTVFAGIRWKFWDPVWQREPEFEQDNVNDRVGFNYVMSVVCVWSLVLHLAADVWRCRAPVARDIQDDLYSKFAYIFTKSIYSIPGSVGIFVAYTVPAYLLAGVRFPLDDHLNYFYLYLGVMMVYLLLLRSIVLLLTYLCPSLPLAMGIMGALTLVTSLVTGFSLHQDELPPWISWLRYVSSQYWLTEPVLRGEFNTVTNFYCHANPMITDSGIIKQIGCGIPTGTKALEYYSLSPWRLAGLAGLRSADPVLVVVILGLCATAAVTVAYILIFLLLPVQAKQKKRKMQ